MFICFCVYILTLVESFIGHAVDVTGAALGDKPLHHCVHTGLPVRTPDSPADGQTKPFNTTELTRNRRQREPVYVVQACRAHLVWPLTSVRSPTPTVRHTPVLRSQLTCRLEWYVFGLKTIRATGSKIQGGSNRWGSRCFRVKEQAKYLQCSSSELENASNSRPMLIITMLLSGHTWYTSKTCYLHAKCSSMVHALNVWNLN